MFVIGYMCNLRHTQPCTEIDGNCTVLTVDPNAIMFDLLKKKHAAMLRTTHNLFVT